MSADDDRPLPKRLTRFTPLRYPGGKGKLAAYIKALLTANDLLDGEYVEPYAGGAGIALELLLQEYVRRIHINDVSELVHSFWWSVLHETEGLSRLITDTPRTVEAWDKQKRVLMKPAEYSQLEVGFATFFLNRTNRSGILNGGIIGGRNQTGPWKIDARYNASDLIARIRAIAQLGSRVSLTKLDAIAFLSAGKEVWPRKTLIYLDPPYYEKGRELYYDFYNNDDHVAVADYMQSAIVDQQWIVSYDNVEPIRNMYSGRRRSTYSIGYSARGNRQGSEVMFYCDSLKAPPLVGPVVVAEQAEFASVSNVRPLIISRM
ncbi:DNA adenine methylase [Rhizobium sp. AN5]|uniref:DNA adenine methylase n=1 Tax=Rhizobium sp. AN5 TaxID=1855304 RepID=UPI000BD39DF9|nr:DNA adenine methylase [Rhizobium sp. AN5]SOC90618.1 DNA adenine methylase [Rhizobium sp. AN5]